MTWRQVSRFFVVCALISQFGVAAAGQKAIYPPHRRGVATPAVQSANAVVSEAVPASSATWTRITTRPPVSVGAMLLLTDGRVLVHSEPNCAGCSGNYSNWYTLTPDNTGSYVNGTWTKVASLPGNYAPLFFASAVLPDGKVAILGGEYNCPAANCSEAWQSLGAIYDPAANTWTALAAPAKSRIGDAQSVVLPDGTWMVAECCAIAFSESTFPVYYYFNESTLTFTNMASASDGKNDDFDEEGWTLLPNNLLLTVDAYTSNTNLMGMNSEIYNSANNTWSTAGSTVKQLWDSNCDLGGGSYELGPAVLRPDGTVFATGSSDCSAAHTAVYNSATGTWSAGPDFPNNDAANDAPAALEINGNVIVEANVYGGTFDAPSKFYEWDGTNLNAFPAPPNAAKTGSYQGHLLVLPNGQIMYTDFTTDVEFLTSMGTYNPAWQPAITSVNSTLLTGSTYSITGTQFNGLSQAGAYGDDFQDATNYPLVSITNNATGHVFYAKTHGHSTMGVATGSTIVSTNFDVPRGMETGPSELVVVANGIPSAPVAVTVNPGAATSTTTNLVSSVNPTTVGQSVTFTATVSPVNSPPPTGTVQFTSNGSVISNCGSVAVTSSGIAQCTTSFSAAGTDSVVAVYSGDANYQGSTSNTVSQVVNGGKATTTTKLVSSVNPSIIGQVVKFTATISPSTATGTVKFTRNGNTITRCSAVTVVAGSASCSGSFGQARTFSMVAIYSGDSKDQGSTSNTVLQVVTP